MIMPCKTSKWSIEPTTNSWDSWYAPSHLLKHLMLAKGRQLWGTWVGDERLQIGHQAAKILVDSLAKFYTSYMTQQTNDRIKVLQKVIYSVEIFTWMRLLDAASTSSYMPPIHRPFSCKCTTNARVLCGISTNSK